MEQLEHDMKQLLKNPLSERDFAFIFELLPDQADENKSLQLAQDWRQAGNKLYGSCRTVPDFHNVYSHYAKSIAYAPSDSPEMALAYSNLSAVLLRLQKYTESLQAIDCCLSLNYPEESKFKIFLRKIECLKILGMSLKARRAYNETLSWVEQNHKDESNKTEMLSKLSDCYNKNVEVKKRFTEDEIDIIWDTLSIQKFNEEVPGVSSAIRLSHSQSKGRHFVATRDIKPGEMLVKSKGPYALVSLKDSQYQCCWACHKFMANCIPCDCCKNVIFCSEECKQEAWKEYHEVECPLLNYFLNVDEDLDEQMVAFIVKAFRILFMAIKEYGSVQNLRKTLRTFDETTTDPRTKGFTNGKMSDDKYLGFYSLLCHDNVDYAMPLAAGTIYKVATKTNLLGKEYKPVWKGLDKDQDFVFLAALFAKHINLLSSNATEVGHIYQGGASKCTGSGVSIIGSLFNHSCFGNTFLRSAKPFTKAIAVLPIKKGEEITFNYLGRRDCPKSERRRLCQSVHNFICNCVACANNWPNLNDYPRIDTLTTSEPLIKSTVMTLVLYYNAVKSMDFAQVRNNCRNYKSMTKALKEMSGAIEKVVANVSMPCAEVVFIQDTLVSFFHNLHSAFF